MFKYRSSSSQDTAWRILISDESPNLAVPKDCKFVDSPYDLQMLQSAIVTFHIRFKVFKLSFHPLVLKTVFNIVMTQLEQQIPK